MKLSLLTIPTALTLALSAFATQQAKKMPPDTLQSIEKPTGIEMRDAYINWQQMRNNPENHQKKAISAQIQAYQSWKMQMESREEQKALQTEMAKKMVEAYKKWHEQR